MQVFTLLSRTAPLPKRSLGGGRTTPFRRARGRGPGMVGGEVCPPPEISLNARFPTPPAARAGFARRH
ncbi:MAG TPA: hypothetical protein DDX19_23855 [Rhodopirellula baltica]|nr:hypothetical protein [Rhodopirellula baltica]